MRLLEELKRRNVIRMAGLYLVGAWLLVQVASTLFPAFGVPGWALRALVIVLALGFLAALVFAWAFELTPDGIKRDEDVDKTRSIAPQTAQRMNRLILAVLALALVYFVFDKFALAPRREAALVVATTRTAKLAEAKPVAAKVDDRSIAVLPFVNMSGDKDNEFFSDGISEELLNVLVRVPGLGVASRTSSFAFKGKEIGAAEIARQLAVRYILEGSVRKQGGKVRITAQLIDARGDRHLWSNTYDRELTDIFKIQDEISSAIVQALQASLGPQAAAPSVAVHADTENMQAYELYLKARELFIARSELLESVRLFERAVALDPKFARGWEGLAAVSAVMRSWGHVDRDYWALADSAARQALDLDSTLSMPWAVLAQTSRHSWPVDWAKAFGLFDRALAADPRNATALHWRSMFWSELGFLDRAVADSQHCLVLEPRYYNCERHLALFRLQQGREAEAVELFNHGVAAGFVNSRAENFMPVLYAHGDRTAALLLLDDSPLPPDLKALAIQSLGKPMAPGTRYRALVDAFAAKPDERQNKNVDATRLYLWLGDYERAGSGDDTGNATSVVWDRYPPLWPNSAGMKHKLVAMGALDYWRKAGFPPQCHPAGARDFNCELAVAGPASPSAAKAP